MGHQIKLGRSGQLCLTLPQTELQVARDKFHTCFSIFLIPAHTTRQMLSCQVTGDTMTEGTDKLADKQTDRFESSSRVAIETCHCLMLQPWSFGSSFKSHYTNYRFMTREPGANFNSCQDGMDCGLMVPETHTHTHTHTKTQREREQVGCLGMNPHKF